MFIVMSYVLFSLLFVCFRYCRHGEIKFIYDQSQDETSFQLKYLYGKELILIMMRGPLKYSLWRLAIWLKSKKCLCVL